MDAAVRIDGLFRYPIKGLSAQPVGRVDLEAGRPFPMDRVFALARAGSGIDAQRPHWAKKGRFVVLMLDAALAEIQTELDTDTWALTIRRDGRTVVSADLRDRAQHATVEAFIRDLVPGLRAAPILVAAADRAEPGAHFMDKPGPVLSLINLATLRDLEARWGYPIDPLRFRANIYIDGAPPWSEFDWVGAELAIGGARFVVESRNGRCAATNVDPRTGQRDRTIPADLRAAFGHKDLGIYLLTRQGGAIAVGDDVTIGALAPPPAGAAPAGSPPPAGSLICAGCFYVHVPGPGTDHASLPADWICPDCGAGRDAFRPLGAA